MKIKAKTKKCSVHVEVWEDYGEVQVIVDGKASYLPLNALSQIIDALAVAEKAEHYKTVLA